MFTHEIKDQEKRVQKSKNAIRKEKCENIQNNYETISTLNT